MNPRVLLLLLRSNGTHVGVFALPIVAFATVTALVLTVLGGAQSFWAWTEPEAPIYHMLAAIALVLLLVPLLTLGGSAARLSARRRDERLSTLRLLGVTPAGVVIATVVESAVIALAGAAAGVIVHLILVPVVGLIPFRGEPLGAGAVLLSPATVIAVIAGIVVLAATSAAIGLQKVIISPLGVRMRASGGRVHWARAIIAVVVIAAAYVLISVFPSVADMMPTIIVLSAMFAIGFSILNVVGPWVLGIQGRRRLTRATRADQLLSARLVLESPKAAWRQVSAISMASFMAVFAGSAVALLNVMGAGTEEDTQLAADIRTGLIITLVATFLMVAASIGVSQGAQILDREELHRSLHRLGMPEQTVDRARSSAVMAPLLMTAIGSAVTAGVLILPVLGIAVIAAPLSIVTIASVIAVGIALVWLGVRVTRPLLAQSFQLA